MVVLTCHVTWAERNCRNSCKAGEHRRAASCFGTERVGCGPRTGSPTRSFGTTGTPLRRTGSGFGFKGDPEAQGGVHSKAPRRPGETAQALQRNQPPHAQFSRCAGSRGVLGQDPWRVARCRISESKSTMSSTGWARITSAKHTEFLFPSVGNAEKE